jgi:membrane protease YdiL (CAAX protease family)
VRYGEIDCLGAVWDNKQVLVSHRAGVFGRMSDVLKNGVAIFLAAITLATLLMLRIGAGMSWSGLGLGPTALAPPKVALGALLGAAAIGLPCAALLVSHELRAQSSAAGGWWNAALFDLAFFILAAAVEELLMRGYIFALLRSRWGWKTSLIATSVAFGLLHIFNPGATVESILSVTVAGFFLGAILLVTGSLYATIAAHVAWNWVMSGIFHTAVSGAGLPSPNYTVVDNGPDWLTGGAWGPEGGAAAAATMLAVIIWLYKRNLRRMES